MSSSFPTPPAPPFTDPAGEADLPNANCSDRVRFTFAWDLLCVAAELDATGSGIPPVLSFLFLVGGAGDRDGISCNKPSSSTVYATLRERLEATDS